jgi:hypothetical protein
LASVTVQFVFVFGVRVPELHCSELTLIGGVTVIDADLVDPLMVAMTLTF